MCNSTNASDQSEYVIIHNFLIEKLIIVMIWNQFACL